MLKLLVPLEANVHGHVLAGELAAHKAVSLIDVLQAGRVVVAHLGAQVRREACDKEKNELLINTGSVFFICKSSPKAHPNLLKLLRQMGFHLPKMLTQGSKYMVQVAPVGLWQPVWKKVCCLRIVRITYKARGKATHVFEALGAELEVPVLLSPVGLVDELEFPRSHLGQQELARQRSS